jgi:hypothetical protein
MASLNADTLARLRRCRDTSMPVSYELLEAAIECIKCVIDADVIRSERNELIRRAAQMLPPATTWRLAGRLVMEHKAMMRTWSVLEQRAPLEPYNTPRDCLHAARLFTELPASQRTFDRVLKASDH